MSKINEILNYMIEEKLGYMTLDTSTVVMIDSQFESLKKEVEFLKESLKSMEEYKNILRDKMMERSTLTVKEAADWSKEHEQYEKALYNCEAFLENRISMDTLAKRSGRVISKAAQKHREKLQYDKA